MQTQHLNGRTWALPSRSRVAQRQLEEAERCGPQHDRYKAAGFGLADPMMRNNLTLSPTDPNVTGGSSPPRRRVLPGRCAPRVLAAKGVSIGTGACEDLVAPGETPECAPRVLAAKGVSIGTGAFEDLDAPGEAPDRSGNSDSRPISRCGR